jgi:hypothetical protein
VPRLVPGSSRHTDDTDNLSTPNAVGDRVDRGVTHDGRTGTDPSGDDSRPRTGVAVTVVSLAVATSIRRLRSD